MSLLIENAKQIVTCRAQRKKSLSGIHQSDIGLIKNSNIFIENGRIKYIGKKIPGELIKRTYNKIDASKKVVFPGFTDSHTHLVFAGDRADEYSMRIRGKTYQQISKAGGGIINTVKAVRNASKLELKKLALERLKSSMSFGVTTIEVKSGYGLDLENEIKMLQVVKELQKENNLDILPTFLGAHSIPHGLTKNEYIEQIIFEMIPIICKKKLAKYIDVFCESNYFSAIDADAILKQGIRFGLMPKLHTNQFNSIGGIETAIRNSAISVDHLEVLTETEIQMLKNKNITACVLPGVSYYLDIPYAPARKMIEHNIPVAVSTDFNPGSCMTENIQLIMSLAVHKLNMSIEETINAVTINAAAALGISDQNGSIEVGKHADFLIFDIPDYKHLIYHFGVNMIDKIIKKGEVIN